LQGGDRVIRIYLKPVARHQEQGVNICETVGTYEKSLDANGFLLPMQSTFTKCNSNTDFVVSCWESKSKASTKKIKIVSKKKKSRDFSLGCLGGIYFYYYTVIVFTLL
jgi:hypothetical protein